MSIGAKDYGLIGYNIVSDLVDVADFDGNIMFDENYLPDMKYYQDKECVSSAKRIKALILAYHLEHRKGEDFLMQFIDKVNSQEVQKKLLNRISKTLKEEDDLKHVRRSIMTRKGRLVWLKSLLRFRKRIEELSFFAAFNGKETITELMPKAYNALTFYKKISGICREYDDIMFLLLGDYALQRFDRNILIEDHGMPGILLGESPSDTDPFLGLNKKE